MALVVLPSRPTIKPAVQAGSLSGPFSGLAALWDFSMVAALPVSKIPFISGTNPSLTGTSWIIGQYGPALSNTAVGDLFTTGFRNYVTSTGAILWTVFPNFSPSDSTQRFFWGAENTGGTTPEFSCQKYLDNNWYVGWNNVNGDYRVTLAASTSNLVQSGWQTYVFTWSGPGIIVGQGSFFYRNGVLLGSNSNGPTVVDPGFALAINSSTNLTNGLPSGGATAMFAIWNRFLRTEEAIALSADPYLLYGFGPRKFGQMSFAAPSDIGFVPTPNTSIPLGYLPSIVYQ